MRILVTGGSGLLGSWVVRELARADEGRTGHQVRNFDRQEPESDAPAEFVAGDIENIDEVTDACRESDVVVHLAGIPRNGLEPPEITFRVNVMGTFNVHEAATLLGIQRVVSIGSEAALGWVYRLHDFTPDYLPIDERHPLQPQDTYAVSKEVVEAIARSYTRRAGLTTIILRPPWVATPDDLEQLAQRGGREVTDFRLYNYVDVRDVASAVRRAVEVPLDGHHALFVTADDSSVAEPLSDLMPRMLPEVGRKAEPLAGTAPSVSNEQAKKVLNWRPLHSWRDLA